MSKPKVVAGAIIVAVMIFGSARISAAQGIPSQQAPKAAREPIRVLGDSQESKLVYRVNPVLPEKAREYRISGIVILQVVINEEGAVTQIKTMRGHPLLDPAARDAVQQWRYSPTYLNGEAVPVIAMVTVPFNADAGRSLKMDALGVLRDLETQLEGEALIQKIRESKETVTIYPDSSLPFRVIQDNYAALVKNELPVVQVAGFVIREGRLYLMSLVGSSGEPRVILDYERLIALANEDLRKLLPGQRQVPMPVSYRIFISETGEVVGIDQSVGPRKPMPALESELLHARVVSPGRRGGEAVPSCLSIRVIDRVVPRPPE